MDETLSKNIILKEAELEAEKMKLDTVRKELEVEFKLLTEERLFLQKLKIELIGQIGKGGDDAAIKLQIRDLSLQINKNTDRERTYHKNLSKMYKEERNLKLIEYDISRNKKLLAMSKEDREIFIKEKDAKIFTEADMMKCCTRARKWCSFVHNIQQFYIEKEMERRINSLYSLESLIRSGPSSNSIDNYIAPFMKINNVDTFEEAIKILEDMENKLEEGDRYTGYYLDTSMIDEIRITLIEKTKLHRPMLKAKPPTSQVSNLAYLMKVADAIRNGTEMPEDPQNISGYITSNFRGQIWNDLTNRRKKMLDTQSEYLEKIENPKQSDEYVKMNFVKTRNNYLTTVVEIERSMPFLKL
jgi:hypothetical protein